MLLLLPVHSVFVCAVHGTYVKESCLLFRSLSCFIHFHEEEKNNIGTIVTVQFTHTKKKFATQKKNIYELNHSYFVYLMLEISLPL